MPSPVRRFVKICHRSGWHETPGVRGSAGIRGGCPFNAPRPRRPRWGNICGDQMSAGGTDEKVLVRCRAHSPQTVKLCCKCSLEKRACETADGVGRLRARSGCSDEEVTKRPGAEGVEGWFPRGHSSSSPNIKPPLADTVCDFLCESVSLFAVGGGGGSRGWMWAQVWLQNGVRKCGQLRERQPSGSSGGDESERAI